MRFILLLTQILAILSPPSNLSGEVKPLRMASLDWPPYYGKKLENQGFLNEIVRQAFREVGYRASLDFMPWSRAMIVVEAGEYDILLGAYYTKERAKKYFISDPIYNEKIRIVTHSDSNIRFYKDLQDLKGYKIGVSQGFANSESFDKASFLTKDVAKNPLLNIRKLLTRRVDMIVVAEDILLHQLNMIKKQNRQTIVFVDPVLSVNSLHIMATRRKSINATIINNFNDGLKKIKSNGTYQKIIRRQGFKPELNLAP